MDELANYLDRERAQAEAEGVTRQENMPFWLPAPREATCALLVHGFTASPWEMHLLGRHLNDRGFACLGVRLPGHGSSPEQLRATGRGDWLAAVRQAAEAVRTRGHRLVGVGSSTGSLLLLRACLEGDDFERLVLCSPFLRVRHRLAPFASLLRYLRPYQHHPKEPEIAPFFYDRRPLAGVAEIHRLIGEIRPRLGDLTQPCLVLASRGDETVDPASAEKLFRLLGSSEKQIHIYDNDVPHVLVMAGNPQLADVLARTTAFLST
ncbi:MAG: alpha/beta fold hydrolase [Geothermobacteraceae bacterium]